MLNVIVNHRVYGKITADLDIRNRRDVERYLRDIESGKSFPLLTVTSGYHFHRIAAEDEQTLDEIEAMLQGKRLLGGSNALRRRPVLVTTPNAKGGLRGDAEASFVHGVLLSVQVGELLLLDDLGDRASGASVLQAPQATQESSSATVATSWAPERQRGRSRRKRHKRCTRRHQLRDEPW